MIDFRPTRLRLEPMAERCLPSHSPVSPNFAPAGREFADTRREDRAPVAPLEDHRPRGHVPPPRFADVGPLIVSNPRDGIDKSPAAPELTQVSPPRTSAALVRDTRPPSGIAALMATEKATGSAAGVATEPAPRSDPRPIAVASAAADASVTVLAAGYGAAASAALFHDARLAQPSEAEVDVEPPAPMPAGSPASVEPVARWYDDLADALPFAGALPFGLDALGQAARGLLSHLEAAADSEATDPAAYDFAWLAGATAALGGAGYAARGAAERHRAAAAPGPRSPLAAWGGRHARD